MRPMRAGVCASQPCRPGESIIMADHRSASSRRRAGRPPAGAKEGEKVKDYPQLSIRVPVEMKARLNALSAVMGLAQWRVVVEAIDCFVQDLSPTDRALVDGLSQRLLRAG
jgi:predicted DNA-binding protein